MVNLSVPTYLYHNAPLSMFSFSEYIIVSVFRFIFMVTNLIDRIRLSELI